MLSFLAINGSNVDEKNQINKTKHKISFTRCHNEGGPGGTPWDQGDPKVQGLGGYIYFYELFY